MESCQSSAGRGAFSPERVESAAERPCQDPDTTKPLAATSVGSTRRGGYRRRDSLWGTVWGDPQKVEHRGASDPAGPLLGVCQEKREHAPTEVCTQAFTALFQRPKCGDNPNVPPLMTETRDAAPPPRGTRFSHKKGRSPDTRTATRMSVKT